MQLRKVFQAILGLAVLLMLMASVALMRSNRTRSSHYEDLTPSSDSSKFQKRHRRKDDDSQFNGSAQWSAAAAAEGPGSDQRHRLQLLKRFCSDPRRRRSVSTRGPLRHIIYSNKLRFAFCEIGKVASSTWRSVLKMALGDIDLVDGRASDAFSPLRQYTAETARRYFMFVFVRHPFERLVSAYFEKFHYRKTEYWKRVAPKIIRRYRIGPKKLKQRGGGFVHDVTFDEFVRYLIDPRNTSPLTDFHWSPQSSMCQLCRVRYAFVGHYETLHQDAMQVLSRLDIADRVAFPSDSTKRFSTSNNASSSAVAKSAVAAEQQSSHSQLQQQQRRRRGRSADQIRALLSTLTADVLRKLKNFYSNDFEMFGYDPNLYDPEISAPSI